MLETDIIFCFAFCLCWVAQHININYLTLIIHVLLSLQITENYFIHSET